MTLLNIEDDDDTAAESGAAEAGPSPDGPTHVTRELECDLSDAELRERGELMAADERAIERLKHRRKALNADIRGKLDNMTTLAIAIDTRKEVREVACTWRPDYERKQWELMRDDTQAVIQTRAMSALDLQTRLPLESATAVLDGPGAPGTPKPDGDDDDDDDDGDDDDELAQIEATLSVLADDGLVEAVDPANDNVRLLPARAAKDARPTTPAKRKSKTSSKNGRKAR